MTIREALTALPNDIRIVAEKCLELKAHGYAKVALTIHDGKITEMESTKKFKLN